MTWDPFHLAAEVAEEFALHTPVPVEATVPVTYIRTGNCVQCNKQLVFKRTGRPPRFCSLKCKRLHRHYPRIAAYHEGYNLAVRLGLGREVAKVWGQRSSAECAMRTAC